MAAMTTETAAALVELEDTLDDILPRLAAAERRMAAITARVAERNAPQEAAV